MSQQHKKSSASTSETPQSVARSDLQQRPFETDTAETESLATQGWSSTSAPPAPPPNSPTGHSFSNIGIQAKLTVGEPDDIYEQEADQVAAQVMRMADPIPSEDNELVQARLGGGVGAIAQRKEENATPVANSNLESQLNQSKGSGSPLPDSFRNFIEPRMGFSFENVRVHTDSSAVQMNRELNAQAFTHGSDVYFGTGKYDPNSGEGKQLLAHELTHVVQQSGGGDNPVSRSMIQRDPLFDPQIRSSPDLHFALLNEEINQNVSVRNVARAPAGTRFEWKWADGTVDTTNFEPRAAVPAEGARAVLKAKTKKVFEDATVTPAVQITHPTGDVSTHDAPPVSVGVEHPEIIWASSASTGPAGAGRARDSNRLFVGDTLTINAWFENISDARSAGIRFRTSSTGVAPRIGNFEISSVQWEDATSAKWTVRALAAGNADISVMATIPGMEAQPLEGTFDVTAVSDARQFKDRCTTAGATLDAAYDAGREFFLNCSNNYKTGYEAHQAALENQNASNRLTAQLIMGVLLAGIGGAAGGALGAVVQDAARKVQPALSAATVGGITDLVKDMTKYAVRSLPQLADLAQGGRSGSGSGSSGGSGGSEPHRPSQPAGVRGQGSSRAAATDPFGWFLQVEAALATERRQASELIRRLHEAADQALNTDSAVEFDWDPVEVATTSARIDGVPLGQLGTVPSADDYERAFWITWLSQYAWNISANVHAATERVTHYAHEDIGGKLRDEINRVAARFGESGDRWIAEYGLDSRLANERRAAELNRIERGY